MMRKGSMEIRDGREHRVTKGNKNQLFIQKKTSLFSLHVPSFIE